MANDGLLPELDKEIAFQEKWADIMSWIEMPGALARMSSLQVLLPLSLHWDILPMVLFWPQSQQLPSE